MSIPKTTSAVVISTPSGGVDSLKLITQDLPELGPGDVLVKMRAVSLNYRDYSIPNGVYPFPVKDNVVAGSDGAGDVIAVGSDVTEFKVGDKVATLFFQGSLFGSLRPHQLATSLGGSMDGALREYAVFPETGLVLSPKGLSHAEAATLPCAALTAWNALYGLRPVQAGDAVLVQGTGGVSLFGLQFAKAAGCFVVATTSSDEKAEILKELGADVIINYKKTPEWGAEARKHSPNGEGFERVLEIGGPTTLAQSYVATKIDGIIAMMGMRAGYGANISGFEPGIYVCIVRGVFVGSRDMMQQMNQGIEITGIKPVIDKKSFSYKDFKKAYEYFGTSTHVGKVVITFDE